MKRALLCLFAFICVQFVATWGTFLAWAAASGAPAQEIGGLLRGGGNAAANAPMLIAASAASGLLAIALFLGLGWARVSTRWIRSGNWEVLLLCAVLSLGTLVPSIRLQEMLPDLTDSMEGTFRIVMDNPFGYLAICLVAPLAEETVFRGAILRSLVGTNMSHWTAIAISAALFALVHANPAQMPHALLMGLLLGWLYFRTGSILPGVALHWVNNTAAYLAYRLRPDWADMGLVDVFHGDGNLVTAAVAASLALAAAAILALNRRMRAPGQE